MESLPGVSASGAGSEGPVKEVGPPADSPRSTAPASASPSGRSSPPPDCAICLGQCKNKSFTDSCLHQFCFHCLLTWSKIKPECPLCKQAFKSIIHNVKSNHQYEEYRVEPQHPPGDDFLEVDYYETPRFRYRTTLTLHRHEGLALERLLMRYPLVPLGALPTALPTQPPFARHSRRHRPAMFRESVYRHNLWARPLPDITGRHRECSPEFYRENEAQIHRLGPWLQRELDFLISDSARAFQTIMRTITSIPILSPMFRQMMLPFLNVYTDHFLHEFYSFASSPFDMVGYDCAVQYQAGSSPPITDSFVNEVISSSDEENSTDSDIVMLAQPGPSHAFPIPFAATPTSEAATFSRRLGSLSNSVIAIETMSHSDTEDSSDEVVMVGYIKPPHERTPEVVDLLASDSDTVIIEEPRQNNSPIEVVDEQSLSAHAGLPYASHRPVDQPSSSGLVKLSLKRNRNVAMGPDSESEGDSNQDKNIHKYKRFKSRHLRKHIPRDSASTECTDRDTDCTDEDYTPNANSNLSDNLSESSLSEREPPKTKSLYKSKQSLASEILKKLKMNLRGNHSSPRSVNTENSLDSGTFYHESEYDESASENESVAGSSSSKRKSRKKSKHKKRHSSDTASNSSNNTDNQKLKFKSRSKSKERLITKIFENKQPKNIKGKAVLSSKSKAKNKCFVKSSKRNVVNVNGPSTSAAATATFGTEASTPPEQSREPESHSRGHDESQSLWNFVPSSSSSNLLDLMTKSILSPNNPVLSINNENSPSSGFVNHYPNDITSFINQIDESFFEVPNPPSPKPLNLSANKEMDDSFL